MRVYLAGPMTGRPKMNFPRFDEVATDLRKRNYEVVSPAELDSPESRAAALAAEDGDLSSYSKDTGETWGDLLARDVKLLTDQDIQAVVVLEGWQKSRGARLETFVARLCGIPVVEYHRYSPMLAVREGEWGGVHGDLPERSGAAFIEDPRPYDDLIATTNETQARVFANETQVDVYETSPEWWAEAPVNEERVVNETTGGAKGRKLERMELLPWDVLQRDVAPLYAFGAQKYDDHNWRKGFDWSLSFGAMMRHASQFWSGEDSDKETGCAHMASVVFHALALLYFASAHPSLDDRPVVTSLT